MFYAIFRDFLGFWDLVRFWDFSKDFLGFLKFLISEYESCGLIGIRQSEKHKHDLDVSSFENLPVFLR